jgi:hypothetical protein
MAEFKLGRIKFVYQGTRAASVQYVIDDLVAKWNLMADGTKWRNAWATTTYYNLGDVVLL